MNKQALAFLTMFSMILMLSVYYVTLPSDNTKTVMKDETGKKETSTTNTSKTNDTSKKADSKKDTSSSEATKLQENIDQKLETKINESSEVVADAKADETAKKEALGKIDILKAQKELQKSIVDALKKEGYKTAVEISDSTCIVNVFDQKNDKTIAKNILIKTSAIINNKYLVEVTFK